MYIAFSGTFPQTCFLSFLFWCRLQVVIFYLLKLMWRLHLVNILSDLPLCSLSVLVRVGLADPVLPVALSKQQGRGWSLWHSTNSYHEQQITRKIMEGSRKNYLTGKFHTFSCKLPKSYQLISWSADPGRDASFSAEFVWQWFCEKHYFLKAHLPDTFILHIHC